MLVWNQTTLILRFTLGVNLHWKLCSPPTKVEDYDGEILRNFKLNFKLQGMAKFCPHPKL